MKYFDLFYSIIYSIIVKNQGHDEDAFFFSILSMSLNHLVVFFIFFTLFEPYHNLELEKATIYLIPLVIFALNVLYIYTGNRRKIILEMAQTLPDKVLKNRGYILFLTSMALFVIFVVVAIMRAH